MVKLTNGPPATGPAPGFLNVEWVNNGQRLLEIGNGNWKWCSA